MKLLQWTLSGSILGIAYSVDAIVAVRPLPISIINQASAVASTSSAGSSTTSVGTSATSRSLSTYLSSATPTSTVPTSSAPTSTTPTSTALTSTTPITPQTLGRQISTVTLSSQSLTTKSSSLSMALAPLTTSCSACGYNILGTTLTYSDPSAVFSSIDVVATRLTFTYIYPDGSSSLSYALVANYTSSLNVSVPFTTPTTFAGFATPPTWVYGSQTLTAGTTYGLITEIQATSYGTNTIPVQTPPPRLLHKRLRIGIISPVIVASPTTITTPPVATSTDGCELTSLAETFTDLSAYPISDTAASLDAVGIAVSEFFDNPDVQKTLGDNPSCTQIVSIATPEPDLPPAATSTPAGQAIPQILPHIINPFIVPAAATIVATQVPVTYVTANVLTTNGPGTAIRVAPTGVATTAGADSTDPSDSSGGGGSNIVSGKGPQVNQKFAPTTAAQPHQVSGDSPTAAAGDSPTVPEAAPANPVADPVETARQGTAAPGETNKQGNAVGNQVQPTAPVQAVTTPVAVNGQTVTPLGGGSVAVGGQTIAPGSVVTLPNGVPVSVAPGGSKVVVGTQTANLVTPVAAASPVVLPGGATVTPAPEGNGIIVNGQTITAGETGTLPNGQAISVGPGGNQVVVAGETYTLPAPTMTQAGVVINGETVTPVSNGIVVDGVTVTPGQAVTLSDSQIVSVGTSGIVVVGQTTVQITARQTSSASPSQMITSSFPSSTGNSNAGAATTSKIKKGNANALTVGQNTGFGASFGVLLGLIGLLVGI